MKRFIAIFIVVLIVALLVFHHRISSEPHKSEIFLMDTICEIQALGDPRAADTAIADAIKELRRIDKKFGYHNASIIKEINTTHRADDRELYCLVKEGLLMHNLSGGAFSIALAPILKAWGFSNTHSYHIPTEKEFRVWKRSKRDSGIHLMGNGTTVFTDADTGIDLGGIAKGYAVDMASSKMMSSGIDAGIINAGGDIMAFGRKKWRIGLKNPRGPGVITVIPIKNRAIATSGDYERFFIRRGKRFCHILDPREGMPARKYMSVTITADTCEGADAWATAVFVMGMDKARKKLEAKGMGWITIDISGKVSASSNLMRFCPARIAFN